MTELLLPLCWSVAWGQFLPSPSTSLLPPHQKMNLYSLFLLLEEMSHVIPVILVFTPKILRQFWLLVFLPEKISLYILTSARFTALGLQIEQFLFWGTSVWLEEAYVTLQLKTCLSSIFSLILFNVGILIENMVKSWWKKIKSLPIYIFQTLPCTLRN